MFSSRLAYLIRVYMIGLVFTFFYKILRSCGEYGLSVTSNKKTFPKLLTIKKEKDGIRAKISAAIKPISEIRLLKSIFTDLEKYSQSKNILFII